MEENGVNRAYHAKAMLQLASFHNEDGRLREADMVLDQLGHSGPMGGGSHGTDHDQPRLSRSLRRVLNG